MTSLADQVEAACALDDDAKAVELLQAIVHNQDAKGDAAVKAKEAAIYKLGQLYVKMGCTKELHGLMTELRPFFGTIPKAKVAKTVRRLIELAEAVPNTDAEQVTLCVEVIAWCRDEKRTFLRQRVESRLAALYLATRQYQKALGIITGLIREVKRLDDKLHLLEIHLVECSLHQALRNQPKARAALTAARSCANAIYCPPALQAQLDMRSGVLHAEEEDYKTGYSYFYEAFEAYDGMDDSNALAAQCLKYMLMCKVMLHAPEEVHSILNGKLALKYTSRDMEAMKAVASAYKARSLHAFEGATTTFADELRGDEVLNGQLTALYDTLLEENLLKIIEPFSRVEIAHVAKLIDLELSVVEQKLSKMILEKSLDGILDQGAGCLIAYGDRHDDSSYEQTVTVIGEVSHVVDALFAKAQKVL